MRTIAVLLTLVGGLAGIVAYGASQRPDVFGDVITLINTSLLSLPEGTWGKNITLPQRPQGYTPYAIGVMGAVTVLFLLIVFRLARKRAALARSSRKQEEEIATLQEKVSTLEGQLQCLAEPRVLEEKLFTAKEKEQSLRDGVDHLSEKIDDLTEQKDELLQENIGLKERVAALQAQVEWGVSPTSHREAIDKLQERIVELTQRSARYEGENLQIKAREQQIVKREERLQPLCSDLGNSDRLPTRTGN